MSLNVPLNSTPDCIDCGDPSEVIDLEAYGPGKPGAYCTVCFIANRAPGVDHPIHTSVYGEDAEVTTLLDSDTCDNCGVCVIASIKHSKEFLEADADWKQAGEADAFFLSGQADEDEMSVFFAEVKAASEKSRLAHLDAWVNTRPADWSEEQRHHVYMLVHGGTSYNP